MQKIREIKFEPLFPTQINPEKDRLAFFIGAGASRLIGCPGWNEFTTQMIDHACQDQVINYHEGQLIMGFADNKIRLEALLNKYTENNLKNQFYESFRLLLDPERFGNIKYRKNTDLFKTLKAFSNIFDRVVFITTNADTRFNTVYNVFPREIVLRNDDEIEQVEDHTLYRIHGSVEPGLEDTLVFTMQQYIIRYNNEKFISSIKKLINGSKYVIFIGYGLAEIELLKYIIPRGDNNIWLKEYFREELTRASIEHEAYLAMNLTITPYAIDNSGYDQLVTIIENWYSKLKISQNIVPHTQGMVDDAIRSTDQEK